MATHSSILAWRIPWTGAWQATAHRIVKSQKWLKWLGMQALSLVLFMLMHLFSFSLLFNAGVPAGLLSWSLFSPLHILYLCDFIHYPWWLYFLDADDSQAHVQGNLLLAYRVTSSAAPWTFLLGIHCVFFLPLEHICSPGLRRYWLCPLPSCHESLAPVITVP